MPDLQEPDFIQIGKISIVNPTRRFPLGQYIKVGPDVGIMFPAVPFGPVGARMTEALDKLLKLFQERQDLVNNLQAGQQAVEGEESSAYKKLLTDLEPVALEFYEAGLRINYPVQKNGNDPVPWIKENLPVSFSLLRKLIEAAQGETVDADTFPG